MKEQRKSILMTALLFSVSFSLLAQREVSYRILLDDKQVPIEVLAAFNTRYPGTFMSLWYTSHITYWYEDYAQTWYGTWYPTRQTVFHTFEKPTHYEVDFQIQQEASRAIFSRYGQWFETRTKIRVLPDNVALGLKNSEFGDWLWSDHKEKIQTLGFEGYIYRLQVTNRRNTYIVRLNEQGEVVQIKYDD